jgi:hypothetical protein
MSDHRWRRHSGRVNDRVDGGLEVEVDAIACRLSEAEGSSRHRLAELVHNPTRR